MSLSELYPRKGSKESDESEVDIIAVHGLNPTGKNAKEHAWDTWREPEGEKGALWLRDTLPKNVPKARIFLYKYDASAAFSKSQATFIDKANQFLESIRVKREDHTDRPLILMGHSMGGILIEQALINAQANRDYQYIYNAAAALAFFATPQDGGDGTSVMLGKSAVKIAKFLKFQQGDNLVEVLDQGSIFTNVRKEHWRQQLERYQIVSFWGDVDATVPRESSRIGLPGERERIVMLEANHSEVAKFGKSEKDQINLETVLSNVVGLYKHALSVVPSRKDRAVWLRADPENPTAMQEGLACVSVKRSVLKDADAWIRDEIYSAGNLKIQRLSGDTLSMDQCYINLAIVEKPSNDAGYFKKRATAQRTSRTTLLARLKVETPDEKTEVKLSELFSPRKVGNEEKPTRRVLIWGRAGMGKTTLCKKIVHEFTRHPMNKKFCEWKELFDRVLWVPLRNVKRQQNVQYNLGTLFDHEYFRNNPAREDLTKALWSEVHSDRTTDSGNRTLFILDGLDELSQELDPSNDMFRFMQDLLAQPNVIITSRPYGKLPDGMRLLDLELETIGFYPDQVKVYVEKAFTNPSTGETDFKKVGEVQSYLRDHQLIQSLVRIPVQLDAFCYTWSHDLIPNHTPETMTGLYEAMERQLWREDLPRLQRLRAEKETSARSRSRTEVKRLVEDEISLLQIFAFTGLINDINNFESEHREKIYEHFEFPPKVSSFDDALASLSFLRASDTSSQRQQSWTYHFIHQTYQEYFAAQYFVRQWTSRQPLDCLILSSGGNERIETEDFLRKKKYKAQFNILWRFVAGLLASAKREELYRFFYTIEEEPHDLLGPVHQRLVMHCLSEVALLQVTPDFDRLRKDLEGQLLQWVLFECEFTSRSLLVGEMEFPEGCFDKILQQGSESVKPILLNSLERRHAIPSKIIRLITPWLTDSVSGNLKHTILRIVTNPHKAMPDKVMEAVTSLFEDEGEDAYVRLAAAKILSTQPNLPQKIMQAAAVRVGDKDVYSTGSAPTPPQSLSVSPEKSVQALRVWFEEQDKEALARQKVYKALYARPDLSQEIAHQLEDKDYRVRLVALEALQSRPHLPQEIVQAVIVRLQDKNAEVRDATKRILQNQSSLPEEEMRAIAALLKDQNPGVRQPAFEVLQSQPTLSEEILEEFADSLYPMWLERSFEEQTSCYIMDGSFNLNSPDMFRKVHLEDQQDRIRDKIREIQKELGIPLPSAAEI